MKKKLIVLLMIILVVGSTGWLIYTGDYYHADEVAQAALLSDEEVTVSKSDYGWYFDGPSEDQALIFYPGAKVETEAYAPFLHLLASEGMDVCLVDMPFRFAFLAINKADDVMTYHHYDDWYIGGHSLGGAMAAQYAASHEDQLTGVILCSAYPTKQLDQKLILLSLYGSEDKVVNRAKIEAGRKYAPDIYEEYVIQGGNHAQFGNYGRQKGDSEATITSSNQQQLAASFIIKNTVHH